MSEPYLGEIRMFAGDYAPENWGLCNGQLLSIADYQALYALLGTTYGGDGIRTFALPDLQGRIPIHQDINHSQGTKTGTETSTLTIDNIPPHSHTPHASSSAATQTAPNGQIWATPDAPIYSTTDNPSVPMNRQAISTQGKNQPHENMMPSLTITFIIALQGLYPAPN